MVQLHILLEKLRTLALQCTYLQPETIRPYEQHQPVLHALPSAERLHWHEGP